MKFLSIISVAILLNNVSAVQIVNEQDMTKLDEETKASVKKAAAAALKVAVAAKKAEAQESIKIDMKAVHAAERAEQSDEITAAVDKTSQDEEKAAVEKAVAHVERIRQKKLLVHNEALKDIERIKADAQKEHDKINKKTQEETQKAIAKAQAGVKGLTDWATNFSARSGIQAKIFNWKLFLRRNEVFRQS